ncbi:hypothetical protein [Aeromicrobium sp. JJY06]|uniref:hypothetical protein n=1 Tax=Aeromicrobium sp. JJY06 TaxID=3373478 RepID=UPI00376F186B
MSAPLIEEFALALGVTVEQTEPDDTCATRDGSCASYNPESKTLYVCRILCPGRRQLAFDLLLNRVEDAD